MDLPRATIGQQEESHHGGLQGGEEAGPGRQAQRIHVPLADRTLETRLPRFDLTTCFFSQITTTISCTSEILTVVKMSSLGISWLHSELTCNMSHKDQQELLPTRKSAPITQLLLNLCASMNGSREK